jgi:hypothetical protein
MDVVPATVPGGFAHPPERMKVIACATVISEMARRMPATMAREVLDFGLHRRPGGLTTALQAAIDASPDYDVLLLGYGLCSRAVVGLTATHCRLVIPRVHDCIAMFLGSHTAYAAQARGEPGTYYVTKGWIEAGDGPFGEEDRLTARYGREKAHWIVARMLRHYRRLVFIDTGAAGLAQDRARVRETAERFGLRYEEIAGSPSLVEKLLVGPWDRECVVVEPGATVRIEDFVGAVAGTGRVA